MSEPVRFEEKLALALRHRADRAPVQVDPYAVARAAARARRADPVVGRMFGSPWGLARMLLTAVLLTLLAAAALFIGSRLTEPERTMGRVVDAGRMSVEREGHTATRLLDGRVLLVGGDEPPSAELYDPATGTSTRGGSMSTAQRFGMAAALLQDGRVLIVGGSSMEGADPTNWPLEFGEIYDPATRTFGRTAPMVQPRADLRSALTLPDGRVMLAGGSGSRTSLASVELFDPATAAFVPGGSMLVGRSGHTLSLLPDGRVLVAGGWGPDGPTASAEIYDPTEGGSVPTGDMTTPRAYHAAVPLADGRVLLIGGDGPGPDHAPLSSVEAFDPATGTFSEVGRLITERSGPNAVALDDGRVLVAGGNNEDGDPRTVEVYDPATGASTVVGRIEPGQDNGNLFSVTTTLLADGSVLLAGGNGLEAERFDPQAAPIVATPPSPRVPDGSTIVEGMTELRTGHTATRLADGRVLIAGGADGGTGPALASAEIFDPLSGATSPSGTMSAPRTGHAAALLADGRVLVVGGQADADPTESWPSMELYDPATGTFTASEYMTVPQAGRTPPSQAWYQGVRPAAITLPDGRVLVVGWDPGRIDDPMGSLQLYDPTSGMLSAIDVPAGTLVRGVRSATLLPDGRVLFLDGDDDVLEAIVYDPFSGSWEREGTTAPRIASTATVVDGRVLIAGGKAGGSVTHPALATAELWDPATGQFSATGDLGAERTRHAATLLLDGRVLVTGGWDNSDLGYPAPEVWDPVSGTFSPAGSLAADREGHTATLLDDGRVLLVGGVRRSPDRDDPIPPSAELYVGP